MKTQRILTAGLCASALFASGCVATRVTASGGRETTVFGGAMIVATDSFQPTTPATLDVDTSKLVSAGNPTGTKVSLFWGLITLHDY